MFKYGRKEGESEREIDREIERSDFTSKIWTFTYLIHHCNSGESTATSRAQICGRRVWDL